MAKFSCAAAAAIDPPLLQSPLPWEKTENAKRAHPRPRLVEDPLKARSVASRG